MRGSGTAIIAERGNEAVATVGRHVVGADAAERGDRQADLLDVEDAALAEAQVVLEGRDFRRGQRALEVVRHELDDLLAGDVSHAGAHGRCSSIAARTRDRARWSRTR